MHKNTYKQNQHFIKKIRYKTKRNAQINYLSEHDNCNYLPIKNKLEDLQDCELYYIFGNCLKLILKLERK